MALQTGPVSLRGWRAAIAFALLLPGAGAAPREAPAPPAGDGVVAGHRAPRYRDVEDFLGVYAAGRETLSLRWRDGLVVDLDHLSVPVDGRWHETVPTFAVRHRVGWLAPRGVLTLEEQHNGGAHWRYELRFVDGRLDKVLPAGQGGGPETLVRSYRRRSHPDLPTD